MCETLLRGVYKRIFFNPGLYQTEDAPRGNCLRYFFSFFTVFNGGGGGVVPIYSYYLIRHSDQPICNFGVGHSGEIDLEEMDG